MRVSLLLTSLLAALAVAAPPPARGAFPVGVTTIVFTKTSVTTGTPRPLATLVWYPATRRAGAEDPLGRRDATVRPGHYPLILFSHGNCGRPREATYLTKALAAQGFIVAALTHPGNTADDPGCLAAFGDSFLNRVADVRFVLDAMLAQAILPSSRFARRIRTHRIGMSGLSFGGFTTLLAAQQEPRFTAAFALVPGGTAALDRRGISIPTLVIGSERDMIVSFGESEAAYELLHGPRYLVEVLGANHLSAVDECFDRERNLNLCVPGDIAQEDAHRLILRYAVPFFRRYLRRQPAGRRLVRQEPGVILRAEPHPVKP
jgi:predicted dienelactone hydrolase